MIGMALRDSGPLHEPLSARVKSWVLRKHFYWCRPWVSKTLLVTACVAFVLLALLIVFDVL